MSEELERLRFELRQAQDELNACNAQRDRLNEELMRERARAEELEERKRDLSKYALNLLNAGLEREDNLRERVAELELRHSRGTCGCCAFPRTECICPQECAS